MADRFEKLLMGGKIVPYDEARIHIMSPAVRYGATAFEGIRAYWNADRGQRAELMLIEALNAQGLDVPDDPRDEIVNFNSLVDLKASFGEMYQSDTGMGPAAWRRFVAGNRICVIFSQRWNDGPKTPVIRTFFGYYCAAPGETFTLYDAQSLLRTVSISAG